MDMKKDLDTKDVYFSYMLRISRIRNIDKLSSSQKDTWRVSLESTQTRKQVHFASLEEMLIFLQDQFVQIDETSYERKQKIIVNMDDHEIEIEQKSSKDSEVTMKIKNTR